jgi:pimeloyl-ACP methyl ester carboxylesterase
VAEGQLALLVETNHLGDSEHSWPPPCTDTILMATCHRMHDRSYRSGGRLFTQKLDGVAWRSKPSSYIVATKDRTVQPELQRFVAKRMSGTTHEVASSHVPMLSNPRW